MKTRLKQIRIESNYTQQEFADRLGLSRSFIIQIEKGDRQVSDRTIKDICREFRISELWLRTGEGDMHDSVLPLDEDAFLVAQYTDPGTALGRAYLKILKVYDRYPEDKKRIVNEFIEQVLKEFGE